MTKILSTLVFFSLFSPALANYQSLTLKPQKVQESAFKLNAAESTANFVPSNIGIVGMKYLHRPGAMSTVVEIYPNTPAQRAGVQIGDRLLAVDGTNVIPFDSDQVFSLIAGLPGAPISMQFMRCNGYGSSCFTYDVNMRRMDMNELESDRIYRIYKYGQ